MLLSMYKVSAARRCVDFALLQLFSHLNTVISSCYRMWNEIKSGIMVFNKRTQILIWRIFIILHIFNLNFHQKKSILWHWYWNFCSVLLRVVGCKELITKTFISTKAFINSFLNGGTLWHVLYLAHCTLLVRN